jgi:replication-associated recombination protein RarA
MAYMALARQWRPRRFDEMTGQEHVLQALGNALDSGRLHHAFLFAGTRGVGKTGAQRQGRTASAVSTAIPVTSAPVAARLTAAALI